LLTNRSFEDDAEACCVSAMQEAFSVAGNHPDVRMTYASMLISQQKYDLAKPMLLHSLKLWKDLPPDDPGVPDFAERIALSRRLIEMKMHDDAMFVLDRLVEEDDQSVEAWYLGGWSQYLLTMEIQTALEENSTAPVSNGLVEPDRLARDLFGRSSQNWFLFCLDLCKQTQYEDEQLRNHVEELLPSLQDLVGPPEDDNSA
jgi:hypothetical protein